MATRTWDGTTGNWSSAPDWTPTVATGGVPLPGDTAVIGSGTVTIDEPAGAYPRFGDYNVTLGSSGALASLVLGNTLPVGRFFAVTTAGNAIIDAPGLRGYSGSITASQPGTILQLESTGTGGNLVLLRGGSLTVSGGAALDLEGTITLERSLTAGATDAFVNNATVNVLSGTLDIQSNNFTGTGSIAIGNATTVTLESATPQTQTISFTGGDGKLRLTSPTTFHATVQNFAPGAVLNLAGLTFDSATFDTTAHTITATSSETVVATINNVYGTAGALKVIADSTSGDDIIFQNSTTPRLGNEIGDAAKAEHADVVHTMTVPGTTTPITGSGERIGILSDSYNVLGGASTDVKNGYLPSDGVTVLKEGPSGSEDEGRAMAELVHQIAPGAEIDFYTAANGVSDFATGITDLQNAGCNIILDDFAFPGAEPFYQLGSPADTAIANAVNAGVCYFTLADNYGDAYYEHAFTPSTQTLPDGTQAQAMIFSNGTPLQSITVPAGTATRIDLQWDAPFYGTGSTAAAQPDSISFKLFNSSTGQLVATSTQRTVNGQSVAESEIKLPSNSSEQTYNLAIYQNSNTPTVSQIKYIMFGNPSGAQSPGGVINDPDAGVGSGLVNGHGLVPGAITVGATFNENSAAFGQQADFPESFSSAGPGELLFDANGNRLAQPQNLNKVDITGVDGVYTSVPGFQAFYGTSAATPDAGAVAALLLQVNPSLTPAQIASLLEQSAIPLGDTPDAYSGAGLVQADRAIVLEESMACYCTGTLILTARGEVAVEDLAVGDLAVTASGEQRPVKWIGHHEVDCAAHPRSAEAMPVRVAAGALGPNRPARDLWVSPGHAFCLDVLGEVLVPASSLVNGATIAQVDAPLVTYWHVELDSHDILIADGMPAESYMDCGNRAFFGTGEGAVDPDRAAATPADYCRPFHHEGALVEAVRGQLRTRAQALGWTVGGDVLADLHLVVDGVRVEPEVDGRSIRFVVPASAEDVWLASVAAVPRNVDADPHGDCRRLGTSVRALTIDDGLSVRREIALEDPRLVEGWHKAEPDHRWTDGRARLPADLWAGCRGLFFLRVDLGGSAVARWVAPDGLALSEVPGSVEAPSSGLRLVHAA